MWRIFVYILGQILKILGYVSFAGVCVAFAAFGDSPIKILLYVIGCFTVICVGEILTESLAEC